jgi:hypothetical protein
VRHRDLVVADCDANRTSFNLRGLGESSTLTLFDGRRTVNGGSVSNIMPDIALRTVDIRPRRRRRDVRNRRGDGRGEPGAGGKAWLLQ